MPRINRAESEFMNDLRLALISKLESNGFKCDRGELDTWKWIYRFLNYQNRLIKIKRRKVHFSDEIVIPDSLKPAVENIKEKFETGSSVNGFLSKNIQKLDYHDLLLNDWGIYHLHLGNINGEKSSFATRTDELLFVKVDNDDVYFINIYRHGCWNEIELIKIIYSNWPESIERHKVPEIETVTPKLTNSFVKHIRTVKGFALYEIQSGSVYMPFGGGLSSSGHNTSLVGEADHIFTRLKEFESQFRDLATDELINSGKNSYKYCYKLFLNNNFEVYVLEKFSGKIFECGNIFAF